MKRRFLLSLFLISMGSVQAQYVAEDTVRAATPALPKENALERPPLRERLVYGGNVGASFVPGGGFVGIAPSVGYRVNDPFTLGIGATYDYYWFRVRTFRGEERINSHALGARTFALYEFTPGFFAQAEVESINVEDYDPFNDRFFRQWYTSPFIGGGLIQPLGRKGFITMAFLYNLNYQAGNPLYGRPFIIRSNFFF